MSALFLNVHNLYETALNQTDPRVVDYPLINKDPKPVLGLVGFYLLFITVGKKFMQQRTAFNVPIAILFLYNFSLVILSIYIVEELINGVIQAKYNLLCEKLNVSTSKEEMRVTNALWWYFISKAFEFLDTFWMIVRKKFVQVTFLHVFHHSSMLLIEWIVCSYVPGGQAWFGACLNSFVHIVMYSYYALSVIPSLRNKLWWKKYLTSLQLIQFVFTFAHTFQGLFYCDYPLWAMLLQTSYVILMFILFSNFFRQEYIKKANEVKRKQLETNGLKKE